jgi:hypothetical protein
MLILPDYFFIFLTYIVLISSSFFIVFGVFTDGHDSVEDAKVALELCFLKARLGNQVGYLAPWQEDSVQKGSFFTHLLGCKRAAAETDTTKSHPTFSPDSLAVSVHSVPPFPDTNALAWESFSFGYRYHLCSFVPLFCFDR